MKKKLLLLIASIALVITFTSCTTFKATGLSATLSSESYNVVGYMDETIRINKFLGVSGGATLANIGEDATATQIDSAIRTQIVNHGGDAIVNMNIDYSASFFNIIGNFLTWSFWAPSSAHVTGIIVKHNSPETSSANSSGPIFVNMK